MKSIHSGTGEIPDKVYFRIGEASSLVGVDPHVLRYWESEFKVIQPRRAKSKQRLYRRKDVLNFLQIKTLLHDEGYTIAGARRLVKEKKVSKPIAQPVNNSTTAKTNFKIIKKELQIILKTITSV